MQQPRFISESGHYIVACFLAEYSDEEPQLGKIYSKCSKSQKFSSKMGGGSILRAMENMEGEKRTGLCHMERNNTERISFIPNYAIKSKQNTFKLDFAAKSGIYTNRRNS